MKKLSESEIFDTKNVRNKIHFSEDILKGKKVSAGMVLVGFGCMLFFVGCNSFSAKSHNAEGVRMMNASRIDEALDCFEKACATDPNNPDSFYNCGNVYHQLAKRGGNPADFDNARYYYDLCLQREPNHAECNRAKATLLCDIGRSDEAFHMIEAWVNRQPASAEPRIELARLYDENGQLGKARDHLSDAVALDDRNVRAYTALGSVRERMGENQEAISAYQHALALNPYLPDINNRVAALRYAAPGSQNITTPPMGDPLRGPGENALDDRGRTEMATQPGSEPYR
ncbi:MAG: tetratricopeptide repeat protein [Planctomycetia bacterium]|nr:tetratricopeptide repeat protein [Planctomycetia bacterium]